MHPVYQADPAKPEVSESSPLHLEVMERNHVLRVLEQFKFNKVHAAKALGISRRALYRLIAKYHLEAKQGNGEGAGE